MISRQTLGSSWRKAPEPRGKMAWPWHYGHLMRQHKITFPSFLYLHFTNNLQGGGGKSKLFQPTSLVASCKTGLLNP